MLFGGHLAIGLQDIFMILLHSILTSLGAFYFCRPLFQRSSFAASPPNQAKRTFSKTTKTKNQPTKTLKNQKNGKNKTFTAFALSCSLKRAFYWAGQVWMRPGRRLMLKTFPSWQSPGRKSFPGAGGRKAWNMSSSKGKGVESFKGGPEFFFLKWFGRFFAAFVLSLHVFGRFC